MIKSLHLSILLLLCLFAFQLRAQNDFFLPNFNTLGNEEWSQEEECYWEEEFHLEEEMDLTIGAVAIDDTASAGKTVNCEQQYTIVAGDICDQISQNNGISVDDLNNLNDGLNCDSLQVGQNICVKGTVTDDQPGGGGGEAGGDKLVSFDQFKAAVTATNGYPEPTEGQYNSFINNYESSGQITEKRELAMFLAQICWESGGLQFKAEIRCQQDGCPSDYRSDGDDPSKFYYGRGYIQLTWSYNYRAASQDLFGDDRLVTDPDQVANNEDIAWQTAFWFWKTNVHNDPGVQSGQFGSSTNKINGGLECNPCQGNCSKRTEIYAAVLTAFGVNEEPNFAGC